MFKQILKEFDIKTIKNSQFNEIFENSIQIMKFNYLQLSFIKNIITDNIGEHILNEPGEKFFETYYKYFYQICERHIRQVFSIGSFMRVDDSIIRQKLSESIKEINDYFKNIKEPTLFDNAECNPFIAWGLQIDDVNEYPEGDAEEQYGEKPLTGTSILKAGFAVFAFTLFMSLTEGQNAAPWGLSIGAGVCGIFLGKRVHPVGEFGDVMYIWFLYSIISFLASLPFMLIASIIGFYLGWIH